MKSSHKLSDAVHILAYIELLPNDDLSSAAIARSVESNPSLIRRLMSQLTQAGLLTTQAGKATPKLSRPAATISLRDVLHAIDPAPTLLSIDDKTNPQCLVGGNIQQTLNDVYEEVQTAAEAKMASISLQSIIDELLVHAANKPTD